MIQGVSEPDCPCQSGLPFGKCCEPYLTGRKVPVTALQLMRSRFTAYTQKNSSYLMQSWHPDYRPEDLNFTDDKTRWLNLTIKKYSQGLADDIRGTVSFTARFKLNGKAFKLEENSRFEKVSGHWLYLDGEQPATPPPKPARNSPCSCGSGKKFKRCCGL